jgi:hypothetical protein
LLLVVLRLPLLRPSPAVGVGHKLNRAIAPSVGRSSAPALGLRLKRLPLSSVTGVGKNPDSLAVVERSNVGCSQHAPMRIEPEFGQVCENSVKPPRSERWRVLHVRVRGSHVAKDSRHLSPQSGALAVEAVSASGNGDVLARKTSRYHINKAAPFSGVKTLDVRPNRENREMSIGLSLRQNGRAEGITLNCANGPPSQDVPPENASTSGCEKSQLIHTSGTVPALQSAQRLMFDKDARRDPC